MPVYRALTAALAPWARRRLARQGLAFGELAGREAERRGDVPQAEGELWIHAASVGELNAATPLIDRLLDTPGRRIVLSSLTPTAASLAARRFADRAGVRCLLAPLDRPVDVERWLARTRPARLLLIETELWPEMLAACARHRIPVAIANARLSARAFGRYRRMRGLFGPLLAGIGPVACQSGPDADRFAELGVATNRLTVTGNIKFDPPPLGQLPDDVARVLVGLGDRRRWVAGSTHRGEEALVARAHRIVIDRVPDSLLLLVPRHPERADEALETLRQSGVRAARLGTLIHHPADSDLQAVVVDRLGILGGLYATSSANFVGGSLVDGIGGHNLVEAAQAGRPVLTGPFTADQAEAADGLEAAGGLARVVDATALAAAVADVMSDAPSPALAAMPSRAAAFLEGQRGALTRTIEELREWLDDGEAPPSGDTRRA